MKSFLATTAIVLVMGGSAFAQSSDQSTTAPAATATESTTTPAAGNSMQFSAYQAGPTDIRASEFIGQRIYATEQAMAADQTVQPAPSATGMTSAKSTKCFWTARAT